MNKHSKQLMGALAMAAALFAGHACAGQSSDALVFPEAGSAVLENGTFVNLDNLRQVAPGLNKDQLLDLLGHPHFTTGMFGVREWDYLFNFRVGGTVKSCQYKVLFDENYLAKSLHWKDAGCAALLDKPAIVAAPAVVAAPVVVAAPAVAPKKITLSADGLFSFGGGTSASLQPQGRQEVAALASRIQRDTQDVRAVRVTGHTDRIGSLAGNLALSQQRAETVRDLLVQGGIERSLITVSGVGSRQPVVECQGGKKTPELVSCLQPNRRVEIEVDAR